MNVFDATQTFHCLGPNHLAGKGPNAASLPLRVSERSVTEAGFRPAFSLRMSGFLGEATGEGTSAILSHFGSHFFPRETLVDR